MWYSICATESFVAMGNEAAINVEAWLYFFQLLLFLLTGFLIGLKIMWLAGLEFVVRECRQSNNCPLSVSVCVFFFFSYSEQRFFKGDGLVRCMLLKGEKTSEAFFNCSCLILNNKKSTITGSLKKKTQAVIKLTNHPLSL